MINPWLTTENVGKGTKKRNEEWISRLWKPLNRLRLTLFSMCSFCSLFYFSTSCKKTTETRNTTKTVAVVVAFFVCWAPFHAQRLMALMVREPTTTSQIIFAILTHVSGIMYYMTATINPILYSIMSLKFRQAFKDTLVRCGRRPPDRRRDSHVEERITMFNQRSQVWLFWCFCCLLSHPKRNAMP